MEEPTKLSQALTYSIIIIILGIIITVGINILSDQKQDICNEGKCSTTTTINTTTYNYTFNFNNNKMLLYYSFDANNTNDDSIQGINGINGGTTNITGKIGYARHFNFTNITIPDLSLLGLRNHNFTISYWVNKTSGFGDQMTVFSTCPDCFGGVGYYGSKFPNLVLGWDSGTANFFASDNGVSWIANAEPMGTEVYDSWEMYTIIGNGTSLKTYQGNILVTDHPVNYNFQLQNGTNFIIGYQQPLAFGANQLIGGVDEFFYLNRSITQQELDCIYNNGNGQSIKNLINCQSFGAISNTTTTTITTTTGNIQLTQILDDTSKGIQNFATKISLLSIILATIIIIGIIMYFGMRKE